MATLILKDPTGRDRVYELLDDMVAGRASSNPIQVLDEKSSRQHFKVERRDGAFFVLDLGSTNGTRVNGVKITEPTKLNSGDVISVGKTRLEFHVEGEPEALPPAAAPGIELPPKHDDMDDRATLTSSVSDDGGIARQLQAERERLTASAAPNATEPRYVLRVIEGAEPGRIIELGTETVTLGRHPTNNIQMVDEVASNFHSEIKHEPVGYTVSDLGSTNGTKVKAAGQEEFQKVLKAPLRPGAQIRVGKTLLEFQNIGAPGPEDVLPAATDTGEELAAVPSADFATGGSGGSGLKIAALVAIVLIVGAGIKFGPGLFKKTSVTDSGPTKPGTTASPTISVVRATKNLIPNATFDEGTEDDGSPREFNMLKGSSEATVKVAKDTDRPESNGGHVLQISKGGAKNLLKPTVVETREPLTIDPSKTYEIGGWLRNDEDGIFGLRVVWTRGDRSLAEHPVVLKDSQEWKQITGVTLTPPAWATGARVGVFAQGRNGKSQFGDLVFKEKAGTPPAPQRLVKFNDVTVNFDGPSGHFNVEAKGKPVVEDGGLRVEAQDGKAACDFSSAFKPQLKKEPDSDEVLAEGKLYDFTQQDLAPYRFSAKPGAAGVDLRATLDVAADSGTKTSLRFYVVGPAAQGDNELTKADGSLERVTAAEDRSEGSYKGIVFNAGKTPQLAVSLAKPAQLRLKHEGKRIAVELTFQGELQVALAPEDVEQKKAVLTGIAEIDKALGGRDWVAAETKLKEFKEKVAPRSPQATEAAQKFSEQFDSAIKAAQADAAKELQNMRDATTGEVVGRGKQSLQRIADSWKGTSHETDFNDALAEADKLYAKYADADADKKADEQLKQAQTYIDRKIYNVAISFLKKILNDPALSKTATAEKAKPLLEKIEALQRKSDDMSAITDRLKSSVKSQVASGKYMDAIKAIESDPEYKLNKADLTDIQEFIDDLRKKALNKPAQ